MGRSGKVEGLRDLEVLSSSQQTAFRRAEIHRWARELKSTLPSW